VDDEYAPSAFSYRGFALPQQQMGPSQIPDSTPMWLQTPAQLQNTQGSFPWNNSGIDIGDEYTQPFVPPQAHPQAPSTMFEYSGGGGLSQQQPPPRQAQSQSQSLGFYQPPTRPAPQQQQQQQQQASQPLPATTATTHKFSSIAPEHHFNDYFQDVLSETHTFLDRHVLDAFQQMLTLSLCPLQTPVQLVPHHQDVAPIMHTLLDNILRKLQKRVDAFLPRLGKINAEAQTMQLPSLDRLHSLAQKYGSRATYVPHIQNIITSFQDMEQRCTMLWNEHHTLHSHMKREFEQMIRRISTQTYKIYQQICPGLHTYLEQRSEREAGIHREFALYKSARVDSRKQFYATRREWVQKRVDTLQDMFEVTEAQLLSCSDDSSSSSSAGHGSLKYRRQQGVDLAASRQALGDMRNGLVTWRHKFLDHVAVDNYHACLPELFSDLQQLLMTFQYFLVNLIGEKIPEDPQTAFPLAPVQVTRDQLRPSSAASLARDLRLLGRTQLPGGDDASAAAALTNSRLYSNIYTTHRAPTESHYRQPQAKPRGGGSMMVEFDEEDDTNDDDNGNNKSVHGGDGDDDDDDSDLLSSPKQKQQQQHGPKFMGLAHLAPVFREFFQHTSAIVSETFLKNQQQLQRMAHDHAQFKRELEAVTRARNEQLGQAHRYVRHGNGATSLGSDAPQMLQFDADSTSRAYEPQRLATSQMIERQCFLYQKAQDIGAHMQVLESKLAALQPRLQRRQHLVDALARITDAINTFGSEDAQQWLEFIEEEAEFTSKWRQVHDDNNEQYLNFRAVTRQGAELILRDFRWQMSNYYSMSFIDLRTRQDELLRAAHEKFNHHRKTIAEARLLVDISITAISGKLDEVPQETERVALAMDHMIRVKDTLHQQEYEHEMQRLLAVFLDTLHNVIDQVMHEKLLGDFLAYLDKVCIEQHRLGDAPCAKTIQQQLARVAKDHGLHKLLQDAAQRAAQIDRLGSGPLAQLNWVQVVDFPADMHPARINSDSLSDRQRVGQAIRDNVLANEPERVQRAYERDAATRQKWQQFKDRSKEIQAHESERQ